MRPSLLLRRLIALGAVSVGGAIAAAPVTDLVLTDGRTLKSARIVTIGEKTVNVVHAGGVENIAVDSVPLDVLARAQMALQAEAGAKAEKAAELKRKAAEEIAEREKAKQAEIQLRLAAAAARDRAQAAPPPSVTRPANAARPAAPISADAQLLALKAKFPGKRTQTVAFNRDKRPMQTTGTSTTNLQRTSDGWIARTGHTANTQIGRPDTLTVEVPHPDIWSDYKGWVHISTLQSLPTTLAKLDEKIEADLQRLSGQTHSVSSQVNAAQARMTIEWINNTLRPYLAQFRTLAK